jgi:hypothetical protein
VDPRGDGNKVGAECYRPPVEMTGAECYRPPVEMAGAECYVEPIVKTAGTA